MEITKELISQRINELKLQIEKANADLLKLTGALIECNNMLTFALSQEGEKKESENVPENKAAEGPEAPEAVK